VEQGLENLAGHLSSRCHNSSTAEEITTMFRQERIAQIAIKMHPVDKAVSQEFSLSVLEMKLDLEEDSSD